MAVQQIDRPTVEKKVVDTVRELLAELGGSRAWAAVGLAAALDRDLGLGSLERVELVSRIEATFGVELSESTLAEAETPADLVAAVLSANVSPATEIRPSVSAPIPAPASSIAAETLVEILRERATREPERPHIYLQEEGGGETVLRYGDLYAEATEIASGLVGRGVRVGDPVALLLPTSREFFTAFAGILLAGGAAVPLYPPFSMDRIEEYATRQAGILRNCGAQVLITVRHGRTMGHLLRASAPSLRHVTTVEALREEVGAAPRVSVDSRAAALIQYTSGSTGDPKGVLLAHENLLANIRAIGEALELKSTDVGVSWLPLYHDMGLIGCWLTPLFLGFPVTILSPLSFLSRPERWLWTIHARRATLSASPNFGYELCLRRLKDESLEGLDLSSWRGALNGAEPVSARTLEAFGKRFSRFGFRPASLKPVYGLAESTLAVAITPPHRAPRVEAIAREPFEREGHVVRASDRDGSSLRFVSSGLPIPGHEIRVVDEEGNALPEHREGALQFRGPSTMQGYFRNDRATETVRKEEGWMDSGDRAFLVDGEVFVTGRDKDIIIHAGRNLYPHTIEELVGDVQGVRRGCAVAFGVEDSALGTEKLVVVAETRLEHEEAKRELTASIQSRLSNAMGVPPEDVVLVPPRTIPKTSSGKLRRASCRDRYVRGELGDGAGGGRWVLLRLSLLSSALWLRSRANEIGRILYGAYVTLLAAGSFLPVWLLSWIVPSRGFSRIVRSGIRLLLFLSGNRPRVDGLENLRSAVEEPYVLVSNHASYIDPLPLLAALPLEFAFVVKADAMTWPVLGRVFRLLGHLPVARSDVKESLSDTEKLREALRRGRSLFFFPEGTFTRASGLRPFRLGAFKLAAESGKAVVPVSLVGTRRLLRDGTWLPRPSSFALVVGRPILSQSTSLADIVRLRDESAQEIARHIGEPRLDLIASGPA